MSPERWQERIEVNPGVLASKPVIRGTRLSVEFIVDLLAHGWRVEQVMEQYPGVVREDVLACLAYASERLRSERVSPVGGGNAPTGE